MKAIIFDIWFFLGIKILFYEIIISTYIEFHTKKLNENNIMNF